VGSNGCRLVQSDESANSLPIPDSDAGQPTRLFARASDDRLKTSAKHWSVVTGCGRDVSVQLRIVRPMQRKGMKSQAG
jgi:hypothetical protein